MPEEILGCRRDVAGLRETAREVVVERAAAEDVIDDQDRRRRRPLGKGEEPGHPLARPDFDRDLFCADFRDRCPRRDLGVAHD